MGLAPKQRDRLTTRKQVVRCLGACPTFTTDRCGSTWPARKGRNERGQAPCHSHRPTFRALAGTEPVPFLARVFSLSLLTYP